MANDVQGDQFVVIRIEGMHCHRCEKAIRRALQITPGVREVEVDFPSSQASVLYDPSQVKVRELVDIVSETGYKVTGYTQGQAEGVQHP